MEPVLIRTDTKTINEQKQMLNSVVEYTQFVFDQFKAIEVVLNVEQIAAIAFDAVNGHTSRIRQLVVDYIIDSKGVSSFAGVPINRNKLAEMIDTPDLTGIIKSVKDFPYSGNGKAHSENISSYRNYVVIENDVVKKTANADTEIEARLTHYTKNDKGVELANKLIAFANAFNEYATYLNDKESNGLNKNLIYEDKFKGLVYNGGTYQLDLDFIRSIEARP